MFFSFGKTSVDFCVKIGPVNLLVFEESGRIRSQLHAKKRSSRNHASREEEKQPEPCFTRRKEAAGTMLHAKRRSSRNHASCEKQKQIGCRETDEG